ncbi:RING/U-box superfamily protein [Actinidia rufa]|uniref:RING/U-box superfamily protein n=1 Tax=Actinidia rufa TaxID=165716 RepID=A0A7J0HDV0_9ERIC|nr:RING/U-box superfamily protein [Actinidia rufa]
METMYYQFPRFSFKESLKILEADIQHANALASAIPRAKSGARLQMKLVYNHLAPLFLFLLQWMDCSCTGLLPRYINLFHVLVYKVYTDERSNISNYGRKASISDFYAVILPSLRHLHDDLVESGHASNDNQGMEMMGKNRVEGGKGISNVDLEREYECGICLEPCTKMVLPNCCHEMCINCYRDWYVEFNMAWLHMLFLLPKTPQCTLSSLMSIKMHPVQPGNDVVTMRVSQIIRLLGCE